MKSKRKPLLFGTGSEEGQEKVTLPYDDRQYHLHVVGQFGLGKSKFLEHLIRRDILAGEGLGLIDPHGSVYKPIVEWCARKGLFDRRDIVLFEPAAEGWSFGFNPLNFEGMNPDQRAVAIKDMLRGFAQVWGGEDFHRTPRMKRILPAVLFALATKGLTLRESLYLLEQTPLQRHLTTGLDDEIREQQWKYLRDLPPREFLEQTESTLNRLTEFLEDPRIRAMVSQTEHTIDFRAMMDQGTIFLVNLHGLHPDDARLIGSLMLSELYNKALLRTPNEGKKYRSRPWHLYVDECHKFFNEDIGRIITEHRKFGLWLTCAHQNLKQLREEGGEAVFGAVMQIPNKVIFGGLDHEDADYLARNVYLGEIEFGEGVVGTERPMTVDYVLEHLESFATSAGTSTTHGAGSGLSAAIGTREISGEEGNVVTFLESTGESKFSGSSNVSIATQGWRESRLPVLDWLPSKFYSYDDQIRRYMATMVGQPSRYAIVKRFQEPPTQIEVPFVSDAVITDDYVAGRKQQVFEVTNCATPRHVAEAAIAARQKRLQALVEQATRDMEPEGDDFFE